VSGLAPTADDDVARVASAEGLTRHSPRETIGARRPAKGTAGDGLHRPGVDAVEGAKAQGSLGSQHDPRDRPSDPLSSLRHTKCPYLVRQLSGFSTAGSKSMSIVRRARMVSSETTGFILVRASEE
jgi:hypothetical protein